MLAKKYKSQLVSISNQIKGINTLEFKSIGRPFKFLPGQFLHLAIDPSYEGIGQWPVSRCFSIQSNPFEENIKITYAVKGEFTKSMESNLKIGSIIWLKLPYGDFLQQTHNKTNTVFIAGGTGITPFLSLFTHESFKEYNHPRIYLGFRSESYNIYLEELEQISNIISHVRIFIEDEMGVIDINQICKENGLDSNYLISGPTAMIKSFRNVLIDQGVAAEKVLTDAWE